MQDSITLVGGRFFMHEMPQGYYISTISVTGAVGITTSVPLMRPDQRQFCQDRRAPQNLRGGFLGIERRGLSDGYTGVRSADDKEAEPFSPTGAIASILLTPDMRRVRPICSTLNRRQNLGTAMVSATLQSDRNWYDPDVIELTWA